MPHVSLPFSNRTSAEWIQHFQNSAAAEERVVALQAIQSLGTPEEISRCAIDALADSDPSVRASAAKLFYTGKIPLTEPIVVQLERLLTDDDPDVRFEVARSLIRHQPSSAENAAKVLCSFLDEPETHPLMVAAVVTALTEAKISDETVNRELEQRLFRLIDHERGEVREAVACAFAQWPRLTLVDIGRVLPLLDDTEPVVREKIAFALGESKLASEHIKLALQTATSDEDAEVARHATEALQKLQSN